MENYVIIIEPSTTGFAAFSPDVPGCIATGKTVEGTLEEMRNALAFHLEGMADGGETLPEPRGLDFHLKEDDGLVGAGDFVTTLPGRDVWPLTVQA